MANTNFWKTFFSLLGILIGIVAVTVGGMTLYFTWQIKYGDTDTVKTLYDTYETKFSAISDTRKAATHIDNYQDFIHTYNPTLGNPDAPITVLAFIDFDCPYSQEQFDTFKHITDNYEPALYVVFKYLPLGSIHPYALDAARASACAATQNKFWEYHNQLFTQKNLDQSSLYSAAQQTGLNTTLFNSCFSYKTQDKNIEQDIADAIALDLRGTPTYIINGDIIEGNIPAETWDDVILKHLK